MRLVGVSNATTAVSDVEPECGRTSLLRDIKIELFFLLTTTDRVAGLCKSIGQAHKLAREILADGPEVIPHGTFSLFDYQDLIGELEVLSASLDERLGQSPGAIEIAPKVREIIGHLSTGLREIAALTLTQWSDRPFTQGREYRPNDPHRSLPLVQLLLFPGFGIQSPSLSDFLAYLRIESSSGEIPPVLWASLPKSVYVAHLLANAVRHHAAALNEAGSAIEITLPTGDEVVDANDQQVIHKLLGTLRYENPFFSLARRRLFLRANFAEIEARKVEIELADVSKA
jgi:hypothetical protein